MKQTTLTILASVLTLGCGGTQSPEADTFAMQVDRGTVLYGTHCASCHGADGSGTSAPRLVGLADGALPLDPPPTREVRTEQFVTVGDVAAFASVNMPADAPGSLALDEYLAILAFALHANGIDLEQPLTLELANDITIPRD